jgi:hypothetical protein
MDDITREDVKKVIILTVPATVAFLGFFGVVWFALHMIFGG